MSRDCTSLEASRRSAARAARSPAQSLVNLLSRVILCVILCYPVGNLCSPVIYITGPPVVQGKAFLTRKASGRRAPPSNCRPSQGVGMQWAVPSHAHGLCPYALKALCSACGPAGQSCQPQLPAAALFSIVMSRKRMKCRCIRLVAVKQSLRFGVTVPNCAKADKPWFKGTSLRCDWGRSDPGCISLDLACSQT